MNRLISLIAVLFLACVAFGAPPEIVELSPAPKRADPSPPPPSDALSIGKYRWFGISGYEGPVTWEVEGSGIGYEETGDTPEKLIGTVEGQDKVTRSVVPAKAMIVWGVESGTVTIKALGIVEGKAKTVAKKVLIVGIGPRPPPPDPDVDPKPKPPEPSPAPIPGDGLRVLIVYESMTNLPPGQSSAIFGQEFRDYLNRKAPKGPDGRTPEYRIYDKDTPMDNESATWKAAMARKRDSIPWLIVSNGKTGFEGPLPATLAETMKILKQHGGE